MGLPSLRSLDSPFTDLLCFFVFSLPLLAASRRRRYLSRAQSSGQAIPRVVSSCIRFINLHGLQHEGIFRVPGSQVQVNEIRCAFERGEDPLDGTYTGHEVDSVAGVLKLYFRGLEKPLFPNDMFADLLSCIQLESAHERVAHVKQLVQRLPPAVTLVLRYLFAFLNHLSQYSDENMMDPYNLAVCFGPTLVSIPEGQDPVSVQARVNEVVKTIIIYQERIFPGPAELEGPVYEKCMTVEEDEDDQIALETMAEEGDHDMQEGTGASEDELDVIEAVARFEYTARSPQELSFKKGDILLLHNKASGDWWRGEIAGVRGLIPHKYINVPEGAQKRLEQRALRKNGEPGAAHTPEDLHIEPGRLRVNSDSACSPRKRSEGSPIRKLNSPFMDHGRLPFPMTHSGAPRLLGHMDRTSSGCGANRNLLDSTAKGASTVKSWQSERPVIEVDKNVTKNMDSVFKELLGKAVLRQVVSDEPGDPTKAGKPHEVKSSASEPVRASPAGKKGAQGRAVFGARR
ncbi:rho GTPase-activating protein 4-like [Discoglossus pictus]